MGKVDTKETPLHQAAEHARLECVKRLLAGGAQVNAVDIVSGGTALHASRSVECVRCLLEAGADVCAVDNWRYQPMHVAAEVGHVECVRCLLEAGADVCA
eukprot:2872577-Rhodomonas_salina.1